MSSLTGLADADFWRRIDRVLADIPLAGNRRVARRFLEHRLANGVKPSTLGIDANTLRGFGEHLGPKPFRNATEKDVVAYLNAPSRIRKWVSRSSDGSETVTQRETRLGPRTREQRKASLRVFYKHLTGRDDPPQLKGLKIKNVDRDALPAEIFTREEVLRMIQAHAGARERAIIAVLAESGLRAGELCSLNIGSVEFDQYGARLTLPPGASGLKTGARIVRLIDVKAALYRAWEEHPRKNDPTAALFFTVSHRAPGRRMTPSALHAFTVRTGKLAGISKQANPHRFRHTAATEKARQGWSEARLRAFFGWSKKSTMPSLYVHLAGKDYEEMMLAERGLLDDGERAKPMLMPMTCARCGTKNPPTATFCGNPQCRGPVAPEAEAELRRQQEDQMRRIAVDAAQAAMEMVWQQQLSMVQSLSIMPPMKPVRPGVTGEMLEREGAKHYATAAAARRRGLAVTG